MDTATLPRKPYPTDVDDEEWSFVVPYLTLMDEAAPQRRYPSRELFIGLRRIVPAGALWRMLPTNLPPWHAVCQTAHLRGAEWPVALPGVVRSDVLVGPCSTPQSH